MKKFLRSTRDLAFKPYQKQLSNISKQQLQIIQQLSALRALSDEAVRGAAIPYLDELGIMLEKQQLGLTETLVRIRDEQLSFARFGDGEFKNMFRPNFKLRFQPPSKELSAELIKVFTDDSNSKCLIGLPTLYRDLHWSRFWIDMWPEVRSRISEQQVFGNSHVSRPLFFQALGASGVNLWRSIWQDRHLIVITGKGSRMSSLPELFDSAASIEQIGSKPVDAFSELPRLLSSIETHRNANKLFLIALGPAGTILAHKISALKEQAIDIGHISDSYQTVFEGGAWPESKPTAI